MSSTSLRLLSAIRKTKGRNYLYSTPADYFDEEERVAFEFVRNFVEQHNRWPSASTIYDETGVQLVLAKEPLDYYLEDARKRSLYMALAEPFKSITEYIQDQKPDDVIATMRDCVLMASSLRNATTSNLISYSDSLDAVEQDYQTAKRLIGLRGIATGYPLLDEKFGGLQNENMYTVVARPGRGKALPLSSLVLKSDGTWVTNGSLMIGDSLASVDGAESTVTGIFDQGLRECYRITFDDGRETVCDLDHLWEVHCSRWVNRVKVLTTRQLLYHYQVSRNKGRIGVPLFSGQYENTEIILPADPYVVGAMLGDGGFTEKGLKFTSADQFIVNKVQERLSCGYELRYFGKYGYSLNAPHLTRNGMVSVFKELGLMGHKSECKFIPPVYLSASREDRMLLLQGMMDTDGFASTCGNACYYTSSLQLANDVQYLVRSLGGLSKITDKKTNKLPAYRVSVRLPNQRDAFSLPRKRERIPDTTQYSDCLTLKIVNIEKVNQQEVRCITVSHPRKLYVVKDFVVTHNTQKLITIAKAANDAGRSVVFLSMEMGVLQLARRRFGLDAGIDPVFLRSGRLSTRVEREMRRQKEVLQDSESAPFYWLAGNFKKSVAALEAAVEEIQPDLVVADAAYLMKSSDRTRHNARHELLTDVMEDIADLLIRTRKAGLISVQFNRTASGAKQKEEASESTQSRLRNPLAHLDLAKIAGTDSIGQITSGAVGIDLVEPPHQTDQRYAGILKNREDEDYGWYKYNYKFRPPNFSQICDYRDYERGTVVNGPDLSYMDVQA